MAEKEYIELERLISDLKDLPEQERIEYMGIYDCIKSQPTADVQEVRHGKWKYDNIALKCSECDKWLVIEQGTADMNFCPHCGAKVRVGVVLLQE